MKPGLSFLCRNCFAVHFLSFICFQSFAQVPTPRQLLAKMQLKITTIQTVSYQLESRIMNGGQDDSVFRASSKTWVQRAPHDTIYGSFFHVRQNNNNGAVDYFYDGRNAIDIYHTHKSQEHAKSMTVLEPFNLSKNHNVVQARTSSRGYSEDFLNAKLNPLWIKYLDSMQVQENESHWILYWQQNDSNEDYFASHRVHIDKASFLINEIHKNAKWRGVPYTEAVVIRDIRINQASDRDSVKLTTTYPDYKITYVNRKNYYAGKGAPSMAGSRAGQFRYATFNGDLIDLVPRKGRLLLLDFWETWCGYCFLAMPKIKRLYEEYNSNGLDIIAVVTENKEQVAKVIASQNFPYPTIYGDALIKRSYQLEERPRYVLIDDQGIIVMDVGGDLQKIEAEIKKRLKS